MCGIAGAVGREFDVRSAVAAMVAAQQHRGPDGQDVWQPATVGEADVAIALGHNRLAIRDLSAAGRQPMHSPDGRYVLSFNGEVYNDHELRQQLDDRWTFRTATDSEVLLAAWDRWQAGCLDRLIGMFAFLLWDTHERALYAVRDRFGVKPLYVHRGSQGGLLLASEIGALFAAGAPRQPDPTAWSAYLTRGAHDEGRRTFWQGIERVEAGCLLRVTRDEIAPKRWYDLATHVKQQDERPEAEVEAAYRALLEDSVRLRFRSDVPVGINLSGGLDSSTLLALVHAVQGPESAISAFTFFCGDPAYDELPWVEEMLDATHHPLVRCQLHPHDVPRLAQAIAQHQHEPFGGLPTLAYSRLFEAARERGVIVLLDGQGMDEQWASYDYYRRALEAPVGQPLPSVQGTHQSPVRPHCLAPELRSLAAEEAEPSFGTGDRLRDLQLRDLLTTKLPRALRFNDRVSMQASCELREPFLDHRLVELAIRQPTERKIARDGTSKAMLRKIASELLPSALVEAPKRPVQTPQREWLQGPLRGWAEAMIHRAQACFPDWLDPKGVDHEWSRFVSGEVDNGFFAWQWISLGLTSETAPPPARHRT